MTTKQTPLTAAEVKAAAPGPGGKERILNAGGGLSLRVRASGSKTWIFVYWPHPDKRVKVQLGKFPDVSLKEARDAADDLRVRKNQGKLVRVSLADDAPPETVKDLFAKWLASDLTQRRKDKGAAINVLFDKHILPRIGRRKLDDVRRGDVALVLDKIKAAGLARTTNLALSSLRQMYRYGVARDYVVVDPTLALAKKDFGGSETERERVLVDDEIKQLAAALARPAYTTGRGPIPVLGYSVQCALWVMLATMARVGELSKARWTDVDLAAGLWRIPAANSKNGRPHLVHLSPFALRHFDYLQALASGSPWVMPSLKSSRTDPARKALTAPMLPASITKQLRDRQRPPGEEHKGRTPHATDLALPGGDWTSHDLRRTGATIMQRVGVLPDIIERCLNHTEENRVKRVYQRAEYLPEREAAFAALGAYLEGLVPASATEHLDVVAQLMRNKEG